MVFSRRAFGVLAILTLSATVQAADRVATDDELQSMFDQKQYRACLQQSARVMQLRGDAAKPYNMFAIHMRRGECYLNVGDTATAALAFTAALAAADTAEGGERARGMVALIKASRGVNYYPKGSPQTPLNIVVPAIRKAAMKAAFDDKFATAAPEIKASMQAKNLKPIMNFVPTAQDLHALEMGGTGADAQSRPMLSGIGEQARALIVAEMQLLDGNITGINARANQLVSSGTTLVNDATGQAWFTADTRLGLTTEDRDALRGMVPYIGDIVKVSQRGKQVAQSLGADGVVWDPIIADATQLEHRAQAVLDAD